MVHITRARAEALGEQTTRRFAEGHDGATEWLQPPGVVPLAHAKTFRMNRIYRRIGAWVLTMHPDLFRRFCVLMRLGLRALPPMSFTADASERADGWIRLWSGPTAAAVARNAGWPLRLRDSEAPFDGPDTRPIVGHVVAGEARGEELWGLAVYLRDGEDEASFEFQERCREALQRTGVVPVEVRS